MANILIIEDDPRMRRLITLILTEAGHTLREACNGQVGLEAVRQAGDGSLVFLMRGPPIEIGALHDGVGRQHNVQELRAADPSFAEDIELLRRMLES